MTLSIGSKVKINPSVGCIFNDLIGIIDHFSDIQTVGIKVEYSTFYLKGDIIYFYEKDLELIRSTIDPTSTYQYCNKCDVLTSNKQNLCCDHK